MFVLLSQRGIGPIQRPVKDSRHGDDQHRQDRCRTCQCPVVAPEGNQREPGAEKLRNHHKEAGQTLDVDHFNIVGEPGDIGAHGPFAKRLVVLTPQQGRQILANGNINRLRQPRLGNGHDVGQQRNQHPPAHEQRGSGQKTAQIKLNQRIQ